MPDRDRGQIHLLAFELLCGDRWVDQTPTNRRTVASTMSGNKGVRFFSLTPALPLGKRGNSGSARTSKRSQVHFSRAACEPLAGRVRVSAHPPRIGANAVAR